MLEERLLIPGFAETDVIPGKYYESDCIDERDFEPPSEATTGTIIFKATPDYGAVRSPAASLGTMITLKTAAPQLSVEDTVDIVTTWSAGELITTTRHSDCGHASLAADGEYEAEYGIAAADVRGIVEEVETRAQAGRLVVKDSKPAGEHTAKGLLVVRGIKTVMPRAADGTTFFRLDKQRHERRLTNLTRYADHVEGVNLGKFDLITVARHQANVTLGILAEGLPVFDVDLRRASGKISERGTIQRVGRFAS